MRLPFGRGTSPPQLSARLVSEWVGFVALALGIVGLLVGYIWPILRDVLQPACTAVVAAALSLMVARVSSRETVREQNTKEGRLRAKRDSYVPVSAEVARLSAGLELAKDGEAPYPQVITRNTRDIPWLVVSRGEPGDAVLEFRLWGEYKRSGQNFDFSQFGAQLSRLEDAVDAYNRAFVDARKAAVAVLTPRAAAARQTQIDQVDEGGVRPFLSWVAQHGTQFQDVPTSLPKGENDWFTLIQENSSPSDMVNLWIKGYKYRDDPPPDTFGWLLAGRLDRAAEAAKSLYQEHTAAATIPVTWIQGIFEEALPELNAEPHFGEAIRAFGEVSELARQVGDKLEKTIRTIQALYEGEPII